MSMVAAVERMAPGLAEGEVRYVRSPSDLLRLVIALVLVAIGLLVTFAARGPLGDLEREVLTLFDGLPGVLRRFLVGVTQLVAIVASRRARGRQHRQVVWPVPLAGPWSRTPHTSLAPARSFQPALIG